MRTALVNGRVLVGDKFVEGQAVVIEKDRIVAVTSSADPQLSNATRHDLQGRLLLPGFIDTQVNGGGGALFNDAPSVDTIRKIAEAHRRFGTTGLLPTLISDDLHVVARAIAAVRSAIEAGVPGVLGIHIEGPFLNVERKGIHNPTKLRDLDDGDLELLTSLKCGKTLVTLAPEVTTPEIIRKLSKAGVIVAAGHTNATYRQIREALEHGLTGFTHLFNAMSQLQGREPGVVGAALDDQHSWCGIIVDGRHVDPVALRLALRCKPHDRFMLATDAMPGVGASENTFQLQGRTITIVNGVCVDENGTLAGSNIDMAASVRNATTLLGLSLPEAVRMASEYPATFLGLRHQHGSIAAGYQADLVVADDDLNIVGTWIGGQPS